MKRTTKRVLAMVLTFAMLLGVCPTNVFAFPNTDTSEIVWEDYESLFDFTSGDFNFGDTNAAVMTMNAEDVEVDEEDPAIIAMEKDLDNVLVAEEGSDEAVPLTEEQKQTILYMYQQYLDFWEANADVLGVQSPFFLVYNDDTDELGVLGELLALANIPVDAVRAGKVSYDDLTGMIMNFMYGDQLGVQYYGSAIKAARNEALQAIEESGAKTEEQKLLVLNDWLAHNCTFDMPYIMNTDKADDEKPMVAETPVEHEHYDDVYDVIYADYEQQIYNQFYNQIYAGIEASFRQQFYEGAISEIIYNAAVAEGEDQVRQQVYANASETYKTAYDAAYEEAIAEGKTEEEAATAADEAGVAALSEEEKATLDQYVEATIKEDIRKQKYAGSETYKTAYDAAYAEAVEAGKTEEEAAAAADEAGVAALSEDEKATLDAEVDSAREEGATMQVIDEAAQAAADDFMTENADAIAEDAPAFVEAAFGADVAAALAVECDAFIDTAEDEEEGVEVDPVNAPGYKMTIAELTEAQMDEPSEDLGGMTPNEAVPVYAAQAAAGLTEGVLNYWEGHHIGALGSGTAVCFGYAKAFTYLVQSMHPEIYGVNGAETDMTVAANWKDAKDLYYNEDGELDIEQDYVVDMVRITFDASISMFGQEMPNFNSDHFWNAVKVNGEWYYVDPCYMDVFIEVMNRDRVETDGAMSHLYFLFSHTTAEELYDGYFEEGGIKTLYANAATSQIYEDSWFSRIASNTYSDGENFYYVYDSTDLITMMQESEGMNADYEELDNPAEIKLVYHPITTTDASSKGDTDYTTLIDFNHRDTEEDEEPEDVLPVARVYNPETDALEENELLTKLIRQHEEEEKVYPSISITTALYDGKLYFNLSNCILSYELETGAVELVKEYNTVYAQRDKTNPFGGMAFTVVDSAEEADLMVENSPIAAMTIKADGNMYVSVATNYAFISGKDPHNSADQGSYGYEFEETNYNKDYNTYMDYDSYSGMAESMGYEEEINDNDEFMWTANFVETLSMSHLDGTNHTYEAVTVDAHCGRNAYTENRCTTCGASEDGTREEVADSAYGHHFMRSEETYYTKDDNGNWNTGVCYVCTECKYAIEIEADAEEDDEIAQLEEAMAENDHVGHEYVGVVTKWAEDYSSATMDVMCVRCVDATLDCLVGDDEIEIAEGVASESVEQERVTITKVTTNEDGTETTTNSYYYDYTAVATVKNPDGKEITVKSVPVERVTRPEDKYDTIPFEDVPKDPDNWYTDPVIWAVEEGITTGTSETTFSPMRECTRAEVVTFLYRTYGKPATTSDENPFTDVVDTEDNWYYDAVLWAVEKGITNGTTDTTFSPNRKCTRAEILTMIWRASGKPAPTSNENPFTDVADTESNWYYDAVLWAVENGITNGTSETTFSPDRICNRAEIVTMLYRTYAEEE